MRRSPRGWWNSSPPAFATAACHCPITSATDGSAASSPRSCSPSWQRPATSTPVSGTRCDRMHESRRRLLLPAGDEGRRHHKILSGGRGGQIPCPPRTRRLPTWTRAGSQNPKPRRTYAAGASSCRVSQGGWEGRDTGRYLGKEFCETRTASPQKVGRASPSDAPSAAAKQAINGNKVPACSGLGRVAGCRSLEG